MEYIGNIIIDGPGGNENIQVDKQMPRLISRLVLACLWYLGHVANKSEVPGPCHMLNIEPGISMDARICSEVFSVPRDSTISTIQRHGY